MGILITKPATWANYNSLAAREEYRQAYEYFQLWTPGYYTGAYEFTYSPISGEEYGLVDLINGNTPMSSPFPSDSGFFFQRIQLAICQYLRTPSRCQDSWETLGYVWEDIKANTLEVFSKDLAGMSDVSGWGFRYIEAGKKLADIKRSNGPIRPPRNLWPQGNDLFCSGVWLLEDLKLAFDALEIYFPFNPEYTTPSYNSTQSTDTIRTIAHSTLPDFSTPNSSSYVPPSEPTGV